MARRCIFKIRRWKFTRLGEEKTRRFVVLHGFSDPGNAVLAVSIQSKPPFFALQTEFVAISRYEHDYLSHDSFVYCAEVYEFSADQVEAFVRNDVVSCDGQSIDDATYAQILDRVLSNDEVKIEYQQRIARANGRKFENPGFDF